MRFAKRGRLRFLSHRDVARSVERAVRRAAIPVAHSHGFSPHPRLSWIGAAPTGSASEAEYLEIGLTRPLDPAALASALDAALPDGLDVLAAVVAAGPPLADLIDASEWRIELPGAPARRAASGGRRARGRGLRGGGAGHTVRAAPDRRAKGAGPDGSPPPAGRARRAATDRPRVELARRGVGLCDNDGGRTAYDTRRSTRRRVGRARRCRRPDAAGAREGNPDGTGTARRPGPPRRSARTRPGHQPGLTEGPPGVGR